MPTPKQVRYHYKRVMKLRSKLEAAMYQANKHIFETPNYETSPFKSLYELETRIKEASIKARAEAMHDEILGE